MRSSAHLPMLLLVLVLLLAVYAVQVARMFYADVRIIALQERQEMIIEENKRIMAARELVRSPDKVRDIAEERFGYEVIGIDNTLYVDVTE